MNDVRTPAAYIQLLQARIATCATFDPEDRIVPARSDTNRKVWIIRRGGIGADDPLFKNDAAAQRPLQLVQGGRLELSVRIRAHRDNQAEVVVYRIAVCPILFLTAFDYWYYSTFVA